jgi:hypothetical protein
MVCLYRRPHRDDSNTDSCVARTTRQHYSGSASHMTMTSMRFTGTRRGRRGGRAAASPSRPSLPIPFCPSEPLGLAACTPRYIHTAVYTHTHTCCPMRARIKARLSIPQCGVAGGGLGGRAGPTGRDASAMRDDRCESHVDWRALVDKLDQAGRTRGSRTPLCMSTPQLG